MAHIVLPALRADMARSCLASLDPAYRRGVVVVNNGCIAGGLDAGTVIEPGENLGVPAAWNLGRESAIASGADRLVILSEAVRFRDGGADFLGKLAGSGVGFVYGHFGWHLMSVASWVLEKLGPFEAGFGLAYYEDNDYVRRATLAGLPQDDLTVWHRDNGTLATVEDREVAGSIRSGVVTVDMARARARYAYKWGGPPGSETLMIPHQLP